MRDSKSILYWNTKLCTVSRNLAYTTNMLDVGTKFVDVHLDVVYAICLTLTGINSEAYLEPRQTSMMGLFCGKSLTIFAKKIHRRLLLVNPIIIPSYS